MKCPKCRYLGFETSERCRNCGYDFSLSAPVEARVELPLHNVDGAGSPLADFDLGGSETARTADSTSDLDLDRLIGSEEPSTSAGRPGQRAVGVMSARSDAAAARVPNPAALPLFSRTSEETDETPLVAPPRPARPPLSVRRTTPEIPRGRFRTPQVTASTDVEPMPLETDPPVDVDPPAAVLLPAPESATNATAAGVAPRFGAALIDIVLVTATDAVVLYLTLAIAGLTLDQVSLIPRIPMAAFLMLMNGGYLIVFTAAGGQTIGKMVTGVRVIRDGGEPVDLAGAVLRAAACALSVVTFGLGYLPALLTADRRALQDRVSGTRVVSAT